MLPLLTTKRSRTSPVFRWMLSATAAVGIMTPFIAFHPWPGAAGRLDRPNQLALRLRHRPAAVFRPQRCIRNSFGRPDRRRDRGPAGRRAGPGIQTRSLLIIVRRRGCSFPPRSWSFTRPCMNRVLPALPDPHFACDGRRPGRLHRRCRQKAVAHCGVVLLFAVAAVPGYCSRNAGRMPRRAGITARWRRDQRSCHARGLCDGGQHPCPGTRPDPRAARLPAGGLPIADRRRARSLRTESRLAVGRPRRGVAW